jgi:AcrR family transcriptional regulator
MKPNTRERVLTSAASLAARTGFDELSLAELSTSSGVSNGSIYHHFGSKDGVLAALLCRIVEDNQAVLLAVLDTYRGDARAGVLQTVAQQLYWVETHRYDARLLIEHREHVARGPVREQVRKLNHHFLAESQKWLARQAASGGLPQLRVEVAHAVVFAPAQEVCRLWLTRRAFPAPTTFTASLGEAAWAGLNAAADPDNTRETNDC